MRFLDDNSKELKWWNRNYFYLATIMYIAINIIFFVTFPHIGYRSSLQGLAGFFNNFAHSLRDVYIHSSWSHVLHNMLCFTIPAFYLERKNGSVAMGLLILFTSVIAVYAGGQSFFWAFMMGYMFIDYLFSFKKEKRNKTNIIVGAVILFLIYFRCCFYDNPSGGISITWYPYQLVTGNTHPKGYFLGLITSLVIQISQLFIILQSNKKEIKKKKPNKFEKTLYIISACLIFALAGTTIGTSIIATRQTSYTIHFVCENSEFNKSYTTSRNLFSAQMIWANEFDLIEDYNLEYFADPEKTIPLNNTSIGDAYDRFEYESSFCRLSIPNEITIYVKLIKRQTGSESYNIS